MLRSDPEGCSIAELDGAVVGVAIALRRERAWVLAELAVLPVAQNQGIGRRLLDAALDYARGTDRQLLTSSQDPRALRRYRRAGFALYPALEATGLVNRTAIPRIAGVGERDPGDTGYPAGLELAGRLDRAARGGAHGPDLELLVRTGGRLLVTDEPNGRGYVLLEPGGAALDVARGEALEPTLLAADGPETAARLLWAALASLPVGTEVALPIMTAGQQWAIEVAVAAGLSLGPTGPLCVRGGDEPGPGYLPHASFL